jgi:hypothetical protein
MSFRQIGAMSVIAPIASRTAKAKTSDWESIPSNVRCSLNFDWQYRQTDRCLVVDLMDIAPLKVSDFVAARTVGNGTSRKFRA